MEAPEDFAPEDGAEIEAPEEIEEAPKSLTNGWDNPKSEVEEQYRFKRFHLVCSMLSSGQIIPPLKDGQDIIRWSEAHWNLATILLAAEPK